MALSDFSTTLDGQHKLYFGTSTPPSSTASCPFYQGDIYLRTDVTANQPALYFYSGTAWKAQGNIAA